MKVKELKSLLYTFGDDVDVCIQVQSLEPMPEGDGEYWYSEYYDIAEADYERETKTLFLMTEGG